MFNIIYNSILKSVLTPRIHKEELAKQNISTHKHSYVTKFCSDMQVKNLFMHDFLLKNNGGEWTKLPCEFKKVLYFHHKMVTELVRNPSGIMVMSQEYRGTATVV